MYRLRIEYVGGENIVYGFDSLQDRLAFSFNIEREPEMLCLSFYEVDEINQREEVVYV